MYARVAYVAVADELDIPCMLTEGPDGRRRAHVDLGHIMREREGQGLERLHDERCADDEQQVDLRYILAQRELERVVPGSATWLLQEGQVRLEQVEVVRACMATRDARSVQIVPDRLACARAQGHTNKGQGRWR